MKTAIAISLTRGTKIGSHRGWDWVIRINGRRSGEGWSSGTKREAREDAQDRAKELIEKENS